MSFVIEKNIELPQEGQRNKYPFDAMEIGDSVFVVGDPGMKVTPGRRMRSAAHVYARKRAIKFTVRRVEENGVIGARVWRIA